MSKTNLRNYAAYLYRTEPGITYKEIARECQVRPGTISKWAREDNWVEQKTALDTSQREMLKLAHQIGARATQQLWQRLQNDEEISNGDIDLLNKLANALHKLRAQITPETAMEHVTDFMSWLKAQGPEGLELSKRLKDPVRRYFDHVQERLAQ